MLNIKGLKGRVSGLGYRWLNIHEQQFADVLDHVRFIFANDGEAFAILDSKEHAAALFHELERKYRNLSPRGGYKPDIKLSIKPTTHGQWRVDFNLSV